MMYFNYEITALISGVNHCHSIVVQNGVFLLLCFPYRICYVGVPVEFAIKSDSKHIHFFLGLD